MDLNQITAAIDAESRRCVEHVHWPDLVQAIEWSWANDAQRGQARQFAMALPVLTCVAAGGVAVAAYPLGAAWRLYTLASAVLDDLVDRDKPCVPWAEWDDHRAMHVGLGLIFAAQHALGQLPGDVSGPVLQLTSRYLLVMTQAQAEPNRTPSIEGYVRHIIGKAGVYCGAFAQAGARLATEDHERLQAMFDFGLAFGVIQQLANDLFDFDRGLSHSDFVTGHLTLPVIYGLSQVERAEGQRLRALLERVDRLSSADWDELRLLLGALKSREYVAQMIAAYVAKAQQALAVFPVDRTEFLQRLIPSELPMN